VKTLRLVVDPAHLDTAEAQETLERGAQILRAGGLVALPTETVYGLGANALDAAAVGRMFEAKRRPAWDPVIVHIAGPDCGKAMLEGLAEQVPEAARRLMEAFWPGPLTLLLRRTGALPDAVTAEFTVCRALLRRGRAYQAAVDKFAPYTEIQDPNPEARQSMRLLIGRAREERQFLFLFVNNRLEGNAPLTVLSLVEP